MLYKCPSSKVSVRKSPLHGNGLFAVDDIAKNALVTFYDGELLDWGEAKRRPDPSYMRSIATFYSAVDGLRIPVEGRGMGSFANHSKRPNAKYFVRNDTCYIKLLVDVRGGEEILVNYGSGYWRRRHQNKR